MKITLESTSILTTIDGVPVRLWSGETLGGVACAVFVHRIAVARQDQTKFEAEAAKVMPAAYAVPWDSVAVDIAMQMLSRLPHTADGYPMTPGMRVFVVHGEPDLGETALDCSVCSIAETMVVVRPRGESPLNRNHEVSPGACYASFSKLIAAAQDRAFRELVAPFVREES